MIDVCWDNTALPCCLCHNDNMFGDSLTSHTSVDETPDPLLEQDACRCTLTLLSPIVKLESFCVVQSDTQRLSLP
jgi:hypothetical protein